MNSQREENKEINTLSEMNINGDYEFDEDVFLQGDYNDETSRIMAARVSQNQADSTIADQQKQILRLREQASEREREKSNLERELMQSQQDLEHANSKMVSISEELKCTKDREFYWQMRYKDAFEHSCTVRAPKKKMRIGNSSITTASFSGISTFFASSNETESDKMIVDFQQQIDKSSKVIPSLMGVNKRLSIINKEVQQQNSKLKNQEVQHVAKKLNQVSRQSDAQFDALESNSFYSEELVKWQKDYAEREEDISNKMRILNI